MSTTVAEPKPAELPGTPPPFEGDDAPVPRPGKAAERSKDKGDDPGDLRRQLQAQEQRIKELSDSERYWAEQAKTRTPKGDEPDDENDAPPAQDDEPEESADDFLDRLSKQGPRAVAQVAEKYAAKAGYVRKQDVEKIAAKIAGEIVERKAGRMTADARLVSEHPELKDESSPVFKATAVIYRQLVAEDPQLKNSPQTLFVAARIAKAEMKAAAGSRRDPDDEPGDYREDREDREDSRRRRIEAQQGDTGRGRSTPYEGDDDPLGAAQREVLDLFSKVGIDDQSYKAERGRLRRQR